MRLMEEKILAEGAVLPGGVLMVGSFLNQQVDTVFLREMGKEIARLFTGERVTRVLTIEASGIAVAVAAAMELRVPMVFAKKQKTSNVDGSVYSTTVHSFTHHMDYDVVVSRDYLPAGERVLLVDDFLANGAALRGLIALVNAAGAEVAGAAVAIEKCFQGGGEALRAEGVRVESLAMIKSMENGKIEFAHAI